MSDHVARFDRASHVPKPPDGAAPLWDAGMFGLDRVTAFSNAPIEMQRTVLDECARNVLVEAWSVERTGVRYCAAMAGWSESAHERTLFKRIGDDEVQHAAWLSTWLPDPPQTDPFNRFIGGLLEAGTMQPLAFLLQVVLEGFGITHYGSLASGCRDASLTATLRRLAIDEALHYGGALLVFTPEKLNTAERRFIADGSYAFLQMFRVGPQAVAAALARIADSGSRHDLVRLFEQLECQSSSAVKLARLCTLMARPGMEWLIEQLDDAGAFMPCTPKQCAQQLSN
ncbi:MAG: hypothetical protein ACRECQ_13255 [Burkholderiaceae bacterium]